MQGLEWAIVLLAIAALLWWLNRPRTLLTIEFARQRWLAGAKQAKVHFSFGTMPYLVVAEAERASPPLLYIHGFTGMKENWLPLMAAMGKSRRQYAPDLPGWGESDRCDALDYGYAEQVERLAEFIDTVIGEPVDLVGHSMGGGISALLAARHPEKVRRLVLVDAAGVRYEDNAFGQAVLDGEHPFAVSDIESLHRYLALTFERPPYVPLLVARYLIALRRAGHHFEMKVLQAIGRSDEAFAPQREASQIKAPTLLFWCKGDRVIDVSAAEIYRQLIPDSRVVLVDGTSHMPIIEHVAATRAALKEFLQ